MGFHAPIPACLEALCLIMTNLISFGMYFFITHFALFEQHDFRPSIYNRLLSFHRLDIRKDDCEIQFVSRQRPPLGLEGIFNYFHARDDKSAFQQRLNFYFLIFIIYSRARVAVMRAWFTVAWVYRRISTSAPVPARVLSVTYDRLFRWCLFDYRHWFRLTGMAKQPLEDRLKYY